MTRAEKLLRGVLDDESPRARMDAIDYLRRLDQAKRRRGAKTLPRRRQEAAQVVDRAARRAEVRVTVAARAGGACEGCFARAGEALHWDHFHGRAREESVESTWMLCPRCDHRKTVNEPSRIHWLEEFKVHCQRHGYVGQVAKVDRMLALEAAQHPAASLPPSPGAGPTPSQTKEGEP